MRSRGPHGFTLVESLLTLFLFALALVVTSKLVTGSQQLVSKASGRSQAIRAVQWGLTEMRQKVDAAQSIDEPVAGSSDKLRLTVFKREQAGRLPSPLPIWRPNTDPYWNPSAPGYLEPVTFSLQADQLMESVGGTDISLMSAVDSLEVTSLEQQRVQIALTIDEGTRKTRFLSRASKP